MRAAESNIETIDATTTVVESAARTHRKVSLLAGTSWSVVGNVVYLACQGLWLILLAKWINDGSSGDFYLGLAIATPILLFSSLSLRYVLATDVHDEYSFTEYLVLRLLTTALALVVVMVAACSAYLFGWFGLLTVFVVIAVGAAKSVESISEIVQARFQSWERLDLVGLSLALKGILSVVGLGVGLLVTHTALGGAIGLTVGWLAVLVFFDFRQLALRTHRDFGNQGLAAGLASFRQRVRTHGTLTSRLIELARRSAPLAISQGLHSLNPNIVMYFTRGAIGGVLFGIFGTLSYLTLAGAMVAHAVAGAITPRLALLYSEGRYAAFRNLMWRATLGVGVLGLLGLAVTLTLGRFLLATLFRPEYADHVDVLAWLQAASILLYFGGIWGYAATATRAFRQFTVPYLGISVVSIVVSALVIPRWGMFGAAFALGAINLAADVAFLSILAIAGVFGPDRLTSVSSNPNESC